MRAQWWAPPQASITTVHALLLKQRNELASAYLSLGADEGRRRVVAAGPATWACRNFAVLEARQPRVNPRLPPVATLSHHRIVPLAAKRRVILIDAATVGRIIPHCGLCIRIDRRAFELLAA